PSSSVVLTFLCQPSHRPHVLLLGAKTVNPTVSLPGRDPQSPTPSSADPQRRMWFLNSLGLAYGPSYLVMRTSVEGTLVCPHLLYHFDSVFKHLYSLGRWGEGHPVRDAFF